MVRSENQRGEFVPSTGVSERDWWDRIGEMRWQHVVLLIAATAAFVALCFAPLATCSISTGDDDEAPTTTEADG